MKIDLTFVDVLRELEVEAVEGGQPLNAFSMAPNTPATLDDESIFGTSVDDITETEERKDAIAKHLDYMHRAYSDRGLVYPFVAGSHGDNLVVYHKELANDVAYLSRISGKGGSTAKKFEQLGLSALHAFIGGWGVGVGAPRLSGKGPKVSVTEFRKMLTENEGANMVPKDLPKSGDCGADGFVILGRAWSGPLVYYQAKNSGFDLKDHPEEYGRIPDIVHTWFGTRMTDSRKVIPVLGINEILTAELKQKIGLVRGDACVHMLDAVDIVCAKHLAANHGLRSSLLQEL